MKPTFSITSGLCVLVQAVSYGAANVQWEMFETSYESAKVYSNAFTEVEVDVVVKQGEKQWKVPAFWSGTPFFWLGDTWWKNLCKRMTWEGFQELTADRKAKGSSVVKIVCGPYPDEKIFCAKSGE